MKAKTNIMDNANHEDSNAQPPDGGAQTNPLKQQPDNQEETQHHLVKQIHDLARELGTTLSRHENDAYGKEYRFQLNVGLAHAVAEILEFEPMRAVFWFGNCLRSCGVDVTERLSCLLDSMAREIEEMAEMDELDEN